MKKFIFLFCFYFYAAEVVYESSSSSEDYDADGEVTPLTLADSLGDMSLNKNQLESFFKRGYPRLPEEKKRPFLNKILAYAREKNLSLDASQIVSPRLDKATAGQILSHAGSTINLNRKEFVSSLIKKNNGELLADVILLGYRIRSQHVLEAVLQGDDNVAKLVINRTTKERLDKFYQDGFTPLMLAVQRGRADIVKLLLENGADPDLESKDGKKAVDYACPQTNIKELFLKEPAKKKFNRGCCSCGLN